MRPETDRRLPARRKKRGSAIMVWLFLAMAGGVLGVFMLQASGFDIEDLASIPEQPSQAPTNTTGKQEPAKNESFAVQGSDVSGFDDDSQPYRISAVEAKQDTSLPNLVHMRTVTGLLRRPDGKAMDVSANNAIFDSKEKSLLLSGQVTIKLADTFVARMESASVDVKKKGLTSDDDVVVVLDGDGGLITSSGIDVMDNGAEVIFRTNVRATFQSGGTDDNTVAKQSDPPASNAKGNLQQ